MLGHWEIEAHVKKALRQFFRPEFLNRLDEIMVFHPLSRDNLIHIVEIQLRYLEQRLADRDLKFKVTEQAKNLLIELGYDPSFGARLSSG